MSIDEFAALLKNLPRDKYFPYINGHKRIFIGTRIGNITFTVLQGAAAFMLNEYENFTKPTNLHVLAYMLKLSYEDTKLIAHATHNDLDLARAAVVRGKILDALGLKEE
ncbi:MAG TPA: hypothetical protein VHF05_01235 [Candidatus Paceibacterota bacterium]|jgi:hypothetical protein|nr:hypothetical protein [Candidatus Paceibacterota bacterium]